jgi:DNA-binding NarL/FixJ family response regulator
MKKNRILIVDDHPLMRQALRAMIADEPDFDVVGEAANGEEAVSLARSLAPDVILMDLVMPVKDGLAATAELTHANPETRILALTSSIGENSALAAVEAGVLGYILKDAQPAEVLHALREVAAGREYWPPAVAARLARGVRQRNLEPAPDLSAREQEVLNLLGQGLTNKDIAQRLVISEPTVRAHVYHILQKLHLENRTQAALYIERRSKF